MLPNCSECASVPSTLGCVWWEPCRWTDWAMAVPVLMCIGAIWKQTAQSWKSKDNKEHFSSLIKKKRKKKRDTRLSPYYSCFNPHQRCRLFFISLSILLNNCIKSITTRKQRVSYERQGLVHHSSAVEALQIQKTCTVENTAEDCCQVSKTLWVVAYI